MALEQQLGGGYTGTTLRRAAQETMQPINWADTYSNLSTALLYRAKVNEYRRTMSEEQARSRALDDVDRTLTRVAQPVSYLSRSLVENVHKAWRGPS